MLKIPNKYNEALSECRFEFNFTYFVISDKWNTWYLLYTRQHSIHIVVPVVYPIEWTTIRIYPANWQLVKVLNYFNLKAY